MQGGAGGYPHLPGFPISSNPVAAIPLAAAAPEEADDGELSYLDFLPPLPPPLPFPALPNIAPANNVDNMKNDGGAGASPVQIREQDRYMPIANVIRIMRKVLPSHAKISDDAKETMQECVSEYISFVTSEANERCRREQRKTITAEDVLWAMKKLGFDNYVEPLTLYLQRYREAEGEHKGSARSEPLPVKRSFADAALYENAPQPPPIFQGPPAAVLQQQQQHHQQQQQQQQQLAPFLDGAAGYYLGVYGAGDGAGAGTSSFSSTMDGFDPFSLFK